MKKVLLTTVVTLAVKWCFCWGFYAHQQINGFAVFLLPPEMLGFYKANIAFLTAHAVDPDKRRYLVAEEGPRHYIDIDQYGRYPYPDLPRQWKDAVARYTEDTLMSRGIVPWWIQTMLLRLTAAFKARDAKGILKNSAEIGHYISDAHVPLHACHNHNGQYTGQKGIHGLWESRLPELLAEQEWDFFIGRAGYLAKPGDFIWKRVLQSAAAADTVLATERELTRVFRHDQKFAFEERNGRITRQYAAAFARAYDRKLNGMVERRMRESIDAVASFWYTAWVNAGQPDLGNLLAADLAHDITLDSLSTLWRSMPQPDRSCD